MILVCGRINIIGGKILFVVCSCVPGTVLKFVLMTTYCAEHHRCTVVRIIFSYIVSGQLRLLDFINVSTVLGR